VEEVWEQEEEDEGFKFTRQSRRTKVRSIHKHLHETLYVYTGTWPHALHIHCNTVKHLHNDKGKGIIFNIRNPFSRNCPPRRWTVHPFTPSLHQCSVLWVFKATLSHIGTTFWPMSRGGGCGEVSIAIKCLSLLVVGNKHWSSQRGSHCGEVAISRGVTILLYLWLLLVSSRYITRGQIKVLQKVPRKRGDLALSVDEKKENP